MSLTPVDDRLTRMRRSAAAFAIWSANRFARSLRVRVTVGSLPPCDRRTDFKSALHLRNSQSEGFYVFQRQWSRFRAICFSFSRHPFTDSDWQKKVKIGLPDSMICPAFGI